MSATVIVLIIIGIIFIFVSYAFSAQLEKSKEEETREGTVEVPEELSKEDKEKIDNLIKSYMDDTINNNMLDIEQKLSEIVNQKTLALGDYAVTVNEEIQRNHNEVMFLYSMLSDKQKEIMTTAAMVDEYRKNIEEYVKANIVMDTPKETEAEQTFMEEMKNVDESVLEDEKEEEPEQPQDGSKDIILEMHKSGLSILEIAKHLGLGVGEVKLVVDLYQGQGESK